MTLEARLSIVVFYRLSLLLMKGIELFVLGFVALNVPLEQVLWRWDFSISIES